MNIAFFGSEQGFNNFSKLLCSFYSKNISKAVFNGLTYLIDYKTNPYKKRDFVNLLLLTYSRFIFLCEEVTAGIY